MILALSQLAGTLIWVGTALGLLVGLAIWRIGKSCCHNWSKNAMRIGSADTPVDRKQQMPELPLLNVELPFPENTLFEYTLSCPHCGFTDTLSDNEMVGAHVQCPCCEETFDVLEPELV